MEPVILGFGLLFGIAVAVGIYLAVAPSNTSEREHRVKSIDDYITHQARTAVSRPGATATSINTQLLGLGEKVMRDRQSTSQTMALLQRADLPWRAPEWGVLRIVSVVVGPLLGLLVLHGDLVLNILGLGAGLALGVLGPRLVLRYIAKRRAGKFERQMPDILMLVASSLSTGFSLIQALDACATDVAQPASKEFSRVMAESRLGVDIEDALERMANRMDSDNMRWTSMAIRIQRTVGGNLAETLRQTAATLRERESLRRHVKALSAEGKLSAYILVAMPIVLFIYEAQVNPAYISLLWTTPVGWGMMIASVFLLVIGIFWMNQVVSVKV